MFPILSIVCQFHNRRFDAESGLLQQAAAADGGWSLNLTQRMMYYVGGRGGGGGSPSGAYIFRPSATAPTARPIREDAPSENASSSSVRYSVHKGPIVQVSRLLACVSHA